MARKLRKFSVRDCENKHYAKGYCKIGDILQDRGDYQAALEQYRKMPAFDRQWYDYAQGQIKVVESKLKK